METQNHETEPQGDAVIELAEIELLTMKINCVGPTTNSVWQQFLVAGDHNDLFKC